MPDITHVLVHIERGSDSLASFHVIAEAGYPEVDDVVSAVEYGPVELDTSNPSPSLAEDDLLAVLAELSAALKDEADIDMSADELRAKAIIEIRSR